MNIPLQSEGISYPIGNDSLFRYTAYKSKEVQLINQLNKIKEEKLKEIDNLFIGTENCVEKLKANEIITKETPFWCFFF